MNVGSDSRRFADQDIALNLQRALKNAIKPDVRLAHKFAFER